MNIKYVDRNVDILCIFITTFTEESTNFSLNLSFLSLKFKLLPPKIAQFKKNKPEIYER